MDRTWATRYRSVVRSVSMPSKRDVLTNLTRNELLAVVERFDLTVDDRRVKDGLVDAVASSKKASLAEILPDLSRDCLKDVCRALALDESGKEKAVLVERIVGGKPDTSKTNGAKTSGGLSEPVEVPGDKLTTDALERYPIPKAPSRPMRKWQTGSISNSDRDRLEHGSSREEDGLPQHYRNVAQLRPEGEGHVAHRHTQRHPSQKPARVVWAVGRKAGRAAVVAGEASLEPAERYAEADRSGAEQISGEVSGGRTTLDEQAERSTRWARLPEARLRLDACGAVRLGIPSVCGQERHDDNRQKKAQAGSA